MARFQGERRFQVSGFRGEKVSGKRRMWVSKSVPPVGGKRKTKESG
jgi:hypothetical protein